MYSNDMTERSAVCSGCTVYHGVCAGLLLAVSATYTFLYCLVGRLYLQIQSILLPYALKMQMVGCLVNLSALYAKRKQWQLVVDALKVSLF